METELKGVPQPPDVATRASGYGRARDSKRKFGPKLPRGFRKRRAAERRAARLVRRVDKLQARWQKIKAREKRARDKAKKKRTPGKKKRGKNGNQGRKDKRTSATRSRSRRGGAFSFIKKIIALIKRATKTKSQGDFRNHGFKGVKGPGGRTGRRGGARGKSR